LPVCPHGAFSAHRAEALAEHWNELQSQLDGQYFTARLTDSPPSLEIQTDLLGMEQVYYAREGSGWVLSNSVQLIEKVLGAPKPLDPLGVSLFLSIGWAGADRTLRRDIRAIPAAQRWTWQAGSESPTCRTYAPMSSWLANSRGERLDTVVDRLSGELRELCHAVSNGFGVMECPLTAGRDSRLLAALLTHEQLPAHYYTSGSPASTDVTIGQSIAKHYNLPHRLNALTTENVVSDWDVASRQYVARNDALSSLWQLASTLTMPQQIEQLQVTLWGIGGEIARGFYYEPELFLPGRSLVGARSVLTSKLMLRDGGLLRPEARSMSEAYIHEFVEHTAADGSSPVDALDLFYAYQRVGR
jgi:asparagine synthase (glutamine-hydrolysing)